MPRPPDFNIATRWELQATPRELTDIVLDAENIHLWCPSVFMESELVARGRADGLGTTIRLFTKGFLPHSFVFTASIVDLVPHRFMKIAVAGDFEGTGTMSVTPLDSRRVSALLHWRTSVTHPYLVPLVRPLHPLFVWNHKWAMRASRRLMQEEIFRRRARSGVFTAARPTFPHNITLFRRWLMARAGPRAWNRLP